VAEKEAREGVVVQCGSCKTTVLAKVIGELDCTQHSEDSDTWYQALLLQCPSCREAVFATCAMDFFDHPEPHMDWGAPKRVWPRPVNYVDRRIPARVRTSLEEARKCADASSFLAAAVMVRRVLEGVANQFDATKGSLPARLRALRDAGVIDARMFEWAERLREHGNLGAHDSEGEVSEQDARDLIEFAEAICDYVFVLTKKFDAFKARQGAGNVKRPVRDAEPPS
jgi:hypothetical protein